jgi:hypothetical protein
MTQKDKGEEKKEKKEKGRYGRQVRQGSEAVMPIPAPGEKKRAIPVVV